MTGIKNWMDVFNSRIDIQKKKISDSISNPGISEEISRLNHK